LSNFSGGLLNPEVSGNIFHLARQPPLSSTNAILDSYMFHLHHWNEDLKNTSYCFLAWEYTTSKFEGVINSSIKAEQLGKGRM